MDEIYVEYKLDLDKIQIFLELIELVKQFAGLDNAQLESIFERVAAIEQAGVGQEVVEVPTEPPTANDASGESITIEAAIVTVDVQETTVQSTNVSTGVSSPSLHSSTGSLSTNGHLESTLLSLLAKAKSSNANLPVLSGTLVLYLCGRFEYYVRTLFEELAMQVATRCGSYERLPREMKKELINTTAEVISNPRKYGHADNGVITFVENLNKNLKNNDVSEINFQCLSITHENMKSDILDKLFARVGLKQLWENLSAQNELRIHFETSDAAQVKSRAQTMLDEIMTVRNNIAHPSNNTTFPDWRKVQEYLKFFQALASTIRDCAKVHVVSVNR